MITRKKYAYIGWRKFSLYLQDLKSCFYIRRGQFQLVCWCSCPELCPEREGVSGKWTHSIEGIPDRLPKMSPSISKKRSWFWLPKVFKVNYFSFWVVNQRQYHWQQMDDNVWLYDIQSYSVSLHQLHRLFKFLSYSTTITMKLSSTGGLGALGAYREECKRSITHTLPLSDIVLS